MWRVPVADVLAAVAPAYGSTWQEVVPSLLGDPDEAETISLLVPHAHGGFDRPVVIDEEDGRVANGMHRIVAAVTSGAPFIDVSDRFPGEDDVPAVEVRFRLSTTSAEAPDLFEAASSFLRSFPIDGQWTECDAFGFDGTSVSGCWYWPFDRADELVAALQARTAARGGVLEVLAVEVYDPDADDVPG